MPQDMRLPRLTPFQAQNARVKILVWKDDTVSGAGSKNVIKGRWTWPPVADDLGRVRAAPVYSRNAASRYIKSCPVKRLFVWRSWEKHRLEVKTRRSSRVDAAGLDSTGINRSTKLAEHRRRYFSSLPDLPFVYWGGACEGCFCSSVITDTSSSTARPRSSGN